MTGPDAEQPKKKVAILGGGLAALATAFELTSRSDDFDITVYQMGWRLGGKCATGRNPEKELGRRIEEHGLHVFFGFYENAFHMLGEAFDELDRQSGPLRTLDDAFKGRTNLFLEQKFGEKWIPWSITLPKLPGKPGDRSTAGEQPESIHELAVSLLEKLHEYLTHAIPVQPATSPLMAGYDKALDYLKGASKVEDAAGGLGDLFGNPLFSWLKDLLEWLEKWLQHEIETDPLTRRIWILAEMGTAMLHGLYEMVHHKQTWSDIDHLDFVEWLDQNAVLGKRLSDYTRWSAPVRMAYELAFAFENGNPAKPNVAAGVAARCLLRIGLGYRGSLYYEMQAGCAEVTATPLYEVLVKRGVKFEWFHRVTKLHVSEQHEITGFDVAIQATVPEGETYQPLTRVCGIDAWPSVPLYDQLVQGDELSQGTELPDGGYDLESTWTDWTPVCANKPFVQGTDFDIAVLGIAVGALPVICADLEKNAANADRWTEMLSRTGTVATLSTQLYFTVETEELGWTEGSGSDAQAQDGSPDDEPVDEQKQHPVLGTYEDPFSNWADFTHLAQVEEWPSPPKSIAYFCGPLHPKLEAPGPGPRYGYVKSQRLAVAEQATRFLDSLVGGLWPKAVDDQNFQWQWLLDPEGGDGASRFGSQYHRANVNRSDRYVNSFKGTISLRLLPEESGVENLYLCGDWVYNGLNVGSAEAAVMSGRMAARAILGTDYPIYGAPPLGQR